MGSQKTPRYQGTITSWKDEQGFGFIAPNGGGVNVFVNIKSLTGQQIRPADGVVVTYELTVNAQGKSRAKNVAFAPLFRQDLIAVNMLRTIGVIDKIKVGDVAGAMPKAALKRGGLPEGPGLANHYPPQPYVEYSEFLASYRAAGETGK